MTKIYDRTANVRSGVGPVRVRVAKSMAIIEAPDLKTAVPEGREFTISFDTGGIVPSDFVVGLTIEVDEPSELQRLRAENGALRAVVRRALDQLQAAVPED